MQKAEKGAFEPFDASDWRIGIVAARFNAGVTDKLLAGGLERAADYKIAPENIDVARVAGSAEIPLVLKEMAASGKYRALLAVGCVVKGATPHFEYVCKFVTEGVLRVQLDERVPVGFGVLTANTQAQAEARAHLGGEHLDAALQQALVIDGLRRA
jgi:6,7-dimethyl-8-ribityllumazine synthase